MYNTESPKTKIINITYTYTYMHKPEKGDFMGTTNIQFHADPKYYRKHRRLPPKKKREINDKLRKLLYLLLDNLD